VLAYLLQGVAAVTKSVHYRPVPVWQFVREVRNGLWQRPALYQRNFRGDCSAADPELRLQNEVTVTKVQLLPEVLPGRRLGDAAADESSVFARSVTRRTEERVQPLGM